jgi:diketogulonate reductase-like aldo/keto reductase
MVNSPSKSVLIDSPLGQGTWHMGESDSKHDQEVAAIRHGIDLGMTLIDTAEMYSDAELVVADAIAGQREKVFVVSKVLPSNASYDAVLAACDRSRQRMGIDTIDWYLLHWASSVPITETIDAFETLKARGAIGDWGVSNFDISEMFDLLHTDGGNRCVTNQVYYSLGARGVEFDLLGLHREHSVATMAYCPLDEGRLAKHRALTPVAKRHQASNAQIALAYLLQQPGVIVIPKSANTDRVAENAGARDITLTSQDLAEIDKAFEPPHSAQRLKIV